MKKILLFGSAFDPIHDGHISMLEHVQRTYAIDEVHLFPTAMPRWKHTLTPLNHRINMVKLALAHHPEWMINLFEAEQPDQVAYTIDTVKMMQARYPDAQLFYLIGMDQAEQFEQWIAAEAIANIVTLIVYPRHVATHDHPNINRFSMQLLTQAPMKNITSTHIRHLSALHTPLAVLTYIVEHDLYYMPMLKTYYDAKRLKHVCSTAKVAYQIAEHHQYDGSKAYLAGILHDVGKSMPDEEALKLIQKHEPEAIIPTTYSYHQYVGAIIAQTRLNIHDEDILDAIKWHTTGNAHMNPYAKIIYAADKVEPTRGYDSKALIDAIYANLDDGFVKILQDNITYVSKKEKKISHPLVIACMNHYLGGK